MGVKFTRGNICINQDKITSNIFGSDNDIILAIYDIGLLDLGNIYWVLSLSAMIFMIYPKPVKYVSDQPVSCQKRKVEVKDVFDFNKILETWD